MRILHGLFAISLFIVLSGTPAWAVNFSRDVTLKGRVSNATGTPLPAKGFSVATFQVCCGTFGATISFLASLDGFNFEPLGCIPITGNMATDVPVTSATARGIWRCDISGINTYVRADLSLYSFGTITVTVVQTER